MSFNFRLFRQHRPGADIARCSAITSHVEANFGNVVTVRRSGGGFTRAQTPTSLSPSPEATLDKLGASAPQ
jgi:hypothetical protein